MIILSGVLVVAAIALLVAGIVAGNGDSAQVFGLDALVVIYISIAVSIVSALCLAIGVFLRRRDLWGPGATSSGAARKTKKKTKKAERAAVAAARARSADGTRDAAEAADDEVEIPAPPADVPEDALVHVVRGRKRYHLDTCRQLAGRETEELTYAEAKEEGFSSCTACLPDTALAARAAVAVPAAPAKAAAGAVAGSGSERPAQRSGERPAQRSGERPAGLASERSAERSGSAAGGLAGLAKPAPARPTGPGTTAEFEGGRPGADEKGGIPPASADSTITSPFTSVEPGSVKPSGTEGPDGSRSAGSEASPSSAPVESGAEPGGSDALPSVWGLPGGSPAAKPKPADLPVAGDAAATPAAGADAPAATETAEKAETEPGTRPAGERVATAASASSGGFGDDPPGDEGTASPAAPRPRESGESGAAESGSTESGTTGSEAMGSEATVSPAAGTGPAASDGDEPAEMSGSGPDDGTPDAGGDAPAKEADDAPADDAGEADDEGPQVRILSGTKRYHRTDCALIEDIGDDADDLEALSRAEAKARGCTPCLVCQPDRERARD
ncbi:hypothetical protein [Actinomadura xylanilytica]|uniref:hypothetical protein n=1 Tax=Actinomadura xylanilytica TaxID=887459 RepID=UPI00255AFF5A|nr:hypothetical protein [Actinomadura xylanilytica]MDL4770999.1 hypothetical protein [Actinomadura xylanilytica]